MEYHTDGMLYHEPTLSKPPLPPLQERRLIPIQAGDPLPPCLWDNHRGDTALDHMAVMDENESPVEVHLTKN